MIKRSPMSSLFLQQPLSKLLAWCKFLGRFKSALEWDEGYGQWAKQGFGTGLSFVPN